MSLPKLVALPSPACFKVSCNRYPCAPVLRFDVRVIVSMCFAWPCGVAAMHLAHALLVAACLSKGFRQVRTFVVLRGLLRNPWPSVLWCILRGGSWALYFCAALSGSICGAEPAIVVIGALV